jgi:TonB family protein
MEAMPVETLPFVPYAASSEGNGKGLADVFPGGFLEGVGGGGDQTGDPRLGGSAAPFFPVHYAHHPKPDYPERARREGWEGTVLLRVLVDQKGRTKWVELNQSSGFGILDRAAIETVKGWRFQPARSGENAVESWVKVPIVFRLIEIQH